MTDSEWKELQARIRGARLEGLLAAAVAEGALPVTPDQHESVRELARSRAAVDLLLERQLLRTAALLGSHDISFRVLKGLAWAHSTYPDPSWRGTGDVDLLLAGADWYRAISALEAAGMKRTLPELKPGFDTRFGKDATLITPSGWEVDLHRVLVVGPFGLWADDEELFAGDTSIGIAGARLPVLDPAPAFVHACYNAVLADDPPRLIALRDVAQMAQAERLDPTATVRLARRWRGEVVVAEALAVAGRRLGVDLAPTAVGQAFRRAPRLRDRALLACYRGPARGYTSQAVGVVAISGWKPRIDYLSALRRPQPSYVQARQWSTKSSLIPALRRLRSRP